MKTTNKKVLRKELQETKDCIAWAAQQTYMNAEKAAKEIEKLTGEEMFLDQAYYNYYSWRLKK